MTQIGRVQTMKVLQSHVKMNICIEARRHCTVKKYEMRPKAMPWESNQKESYYIQQCRSMESEAYQDLAYWRKQLIA